VRFFPAAIGRFPLVMRLINTTTIQLKVFTLRDNPPYAILSHKWTEAMLTVYTFLPGRSG
jgi:hypothetical protein